MSSPQVYLGNGVQTRFEVPGSTSKVVYVGGVLTVPASSDFQSVTISPAPGVGVPVSIEHQSVPLAVTAVVYDGSNRVISYTVRGVPHVVSYPDATRIIDTGGSAVVTAILDGSGRIISVA